MGHSHLDATALPMEQLKRGWWGSSSHHSSRILGRDEPKNSLSLQLFPFSPTKSSPSSKNPSKPCHEPSQVSSPGDGHVKPRPSAPALITKPSPLSREESQIQGNIPKQGHHRWSWWAPLRFCRPRYCLQVLHHHFLAPGAWMSLDSHNASPTVQGKFPGPASPPQECLRDHLKYQTPGLK